MGLDKLGLLIYTYRQQLEDLNAKYDALTNEDDSEKFFALAGRIGMLKQVITDLERVYNE